MRIDRAAAAAVLLAAGMTSMPGYAWVSYAENSEARHYYDPATVRTVGDQKRVWRLFAYKRALPSGVQSGKALIEVDCKAGTYRYLQTLYYSGPMGTGAYLGGTRPLEVEHIAPGTMIGYLASAICP